MTGKYYLLGELKEIKTEWETVHFLKTINPYFDAICQLKKPFELRKNDRNYRIKDILVLRNYYQHGEKYTGDFTIRVITYIFEGGQFGLDPGYCILGMKIPSYRTRIRIMRLLENTGNLTERSNL